MSDDLLRASSRGKLLLAGIVAVTAIYQTAWAQTVNGIEVREGTASVFSTKAASTVQISDYDGNVVAKIPIDENPKEFTYLKSSDTLYVVHRDKKVHNTISVVKLDARRVDKRIPVGAGAIVELMPSRDEGKLYCLTGSELAPLSGEPLWSKSFRGPYQPSVSVIDTKTNEVTSTKAWFEGFVSRIPGKHKSILFTASLVAGTNDGSVAVVSTALTLNTRIGHTHPYKLLLKELETFTGQGSQTASTTTLNEEASAWMLSKDETLLFAAFKGDKKTPGSLEVIDMAKGMVTRQTTPDPPIRFVRLGSELEPWVACAQEMRSMSETGELGDKRIPLTKQAAEGGGDSNDDSIFMKGYPGETISVGPDHAAVLIGNQNGVSRHRVALINLKKLQIDAVIPTMSSGEIAGKRTGRYLIAFGLSMATGGTLIFIPNMVMRNEALAAGPEGRLLYALDVEGHEVTVVDVETSTVVTRLKVNSSIVRLQVAADHKHLICFGKKPQEIDLALNKLVE